MRSETDHATWIEILDPQTKARMFANLVSGHCAWDPPPGVAVKRMVENQWWELYDSNTGRAYYYNPMSTQTVWKRPDNCDIIPLARLQLLKQNTELGGPSLPDPSLPSSSSSTPRNRRRILPDSTSLASRTIDTSHHTANASNEFYANFTNELASQLPDYPSSSALHDSNFSYDRKKIRAPSTCSSRSQASTKSRFNNCIQEMVTSQFAPELTPQLVRVTNTNQPPREYQDYRDRGYSPTSSVSSDGQSADMLSQNTSSSFMAKDPSVKIRLSMASEPLDKNECWTNSSLKRPLLNPNDKKLKKHSHTAFKLILSYMGDKKSKTVPEQTALSILELRQAKPIVTDEIFLQLMKQLTENHRSESVRKGWELLGILLFFFTPESPEVKEKLSKFVDNNSDPLLDGPEVSISKYARHCLKKLQNPSTVLKLNIDAITQARFRIFNPSKFGASLEELMEMQAQHYPHLKLPWIETTLINLILENDGAKTEGIFRIAADPEQVQLAMVQLDQNIVPRIKEAHVAAVLLKQWLRQLPSPLIPESMHNSCYAVCGQAENACCLMDQLPAINRLVLAKLLQLLQFLLKEDVVKDTKMDVYNIAMIFCPNIFRSDSEATNMMLLNQRKQLEFIKTIILHYDTSFVHSLE